MTLRIVAGVTSGDLQSCRDSMGGALLAKCGTCRTGQRLTLSGTGAPPWRLVSCWNPFTHERAVLFNKLTFGPSFSSNRGLPGTRDVRLREGIPTGPAAYGAFL